MLQQFHGKASQYRSKNNINNGLTNKLSEKDIVTDLLKALSYEAKKPVAM
jgi:hypothetical protein